MERTISILISGKVQGVFFRQSAREKAEELGITGRVMNLRDGRVQVIATGPSDKLEAVIAWCRQGPSRARVEKVEIEELPLQSFDGFKIERV